MWSILSNWNRLWIPFTKVNSISMPKTKSLPVLFFRSILRTKIWLHVCSFAKTPLTPGYGHTQWHHVWITGNILKDHKRRYAQFIRLGPAKVFQLFQQFFVGDTRLYMTYNVIDFLFTVGMVFRHHKRLRFI